MPPQCVHQPWLKDSPKAHQRPCTAPKNQLALYGVLEILCHDKWTKKTHDHQARNETSPISITELVLRTSILTFDMLSLKNWGENIFDATYHQ